MTPITEHAAQRMAERCFSRRLVEMVLTSGKYERQRDGSRLYKLPAEVGGEAVADLCVVVRDGVVITVWVRAR